MPNLYIGNANNSPTKLKKIYVGNINNNPTRLKKIWIGDSSNNPVLIFSEGLPDGYLYDFDASFEQYNQPTIGNIINAVNNAPYPIQQWHPQFPSSTVWGLGKVDGRPISFNNQNTVCGRGGTFRLPYPVTDATLVLVQRLNTDMIVGNEVFTNSCYFNEMGDYIYYSDYFVYSGEQIGSLLFRKYNDSFWVGSSEVGDINSFINKELTITWLYTENSEVKTKVKTSSGNESVYTASRGSNKQIRDIRVCDWAGGGVLALTGEVYEFIIWPRSLSEEEKIDAENFLFEKWM